jgi:hypothetical protein
MVPRAIDKTFKAEDVQEESCAGEANTVEIPS